MNARAVCEALQLDPGELADCFRREVAWRHRLLAEQAEGERGPELGGFALERIANYLHLIGELEEEWSRRRDEEMSGGGAKEATSTATAASALRVAQEERR